MDRRVRAGLEGGTVAVITVIVAVIVAHRESGPSVPAKVSLVEAPSPGADHVSFRVRGGGCDKHARERVHGPLVQYTTNTIDVAFRIDRDGVPMCTGADPGQVFSISLVTPLGNRTLRDSTATPPTAFPVEPTPTR